MSTENVDNPVKNPVMMTIEICGRASGTEELDKALELWVNAVPQAKEDIMTFAQQLEQRGHQKGRQEGIEQGRQET